jgi:hypothetical protein
MEFGCKMLDHKSYSTGLTHLSLRLAPLNQGSTVALWSLFHLKAGVDVQVKSLIL